MIAVVENWRLQETFKVLSIAEPLNGDFLIGLQAKRKPSSTLLAQFEVHSRGHAVAVIDFDVEELPSVKGHFAVGSFSG